MNFPSLSSSSSYRINYKYCQENNKGLAADLVHNDDFSGNNAITGNILIDSMEDGQKLSFFDDETLDEEESDEDEDTIDGFEGDEIVVDDDDDTEELESSSVDPLFDEYQLWSKSLDQAVTKLESKRNSLELELEKARGVEATMARAQLIVSNLYQFQNNPNLKSVMVQDWENSDDDNEGNINVVELTLNPQYDSASAEADALFAQARKLKRGSKIVADLLVETHQSLEVLQIAKRDLRDLASFSPPITSHTHHDGFLIPEERLRLIQDYVRRTSAMTNFSLLPSPTSQSTKAASGGRNNISHNSDNKLKQRVKKNSPQLGTPASNVRKLISPGGCTVYVGRNQRGNEYISFHLAKKGNDLWMHARGCPGAHILIQRRRRRRQQQPSRGRRGEAVVNRIDRDDDVDDDDDDNNDIPTNDDDEDLQFAANLAIFYSDARNERRAPVTVADPKHILKPPGAPLGAVQLREECRVLMGLPDMVPVELKEARDLGGGSSSSTSSMDGGDYYRATDKAKHRRKTMEAAVKQKQKRKKEQSSKRKRRLQQEAE